MKKTNKKDNSIIYNIYECFLVVDSIVQYLNLKEHSHSLKILDMGCNNGYMVLLLRQMGYEAYGIDINKYAFEVASDSAKPYLFTGSFADIPFADNTFDISISWGTIEHLPETLSSKCLSEAIRVSSKAVWIGCDNIPQSIEPYHITNYPIDWWEKKLELLGQRVDYKLRDFIKSRLSLRKNQAYWNALECVLNKKI
jgi:ubiquinone/menaquinone biosynthesis C-methylase UbiE